MESVIDYEQIRVFRITRGWAIFFALCFALPALAQLSMMAAITLVLIASVGMKGPTMMLLTAAVSQVFLLACAGYVLSPRGRFRASIGSQIAVVRFPGCPRVIQWSDIQRVEFCRHRNAANQDRLIAIDLFMPKRVTLSLRYLSLRDCETIESTFRARVPAHLQFVRTVSHHKSRIPFLTRRRCDIQPRQPYPPPPIPEQRPQPAPLTNK